MPPSTRQKCVWLRTCASLVKDLERQFLRLAATLREGFVDVIEQVSKEVQGQSPATQWSALLPILTEAERGEEDTSATTTTPAACST